MWVVVVVVVYRADNNDHSTFQDILDEADKDQNGLIDYTEFADMMAPGRA